MTGILSYHLRVWRHLGHLEAGKTIDESSSGSLRITTFKKLPTEAPMIKVNAIMIVSSIISRFFYIIWYKFMAFHAVLLKKKLYKKWSQ
jgi:hypothetical protein